MNIEYSDNIVWQKVNDQISQRIFSDILGSLKGIVRADIQVKVSNAVFNQVWQAKDCIRGQVIETYCKW